MADVTHNLSPYSYSLNNPIRFIDKDGMIAQEGGGIDPTKLYGKQVDMSKAPARSLTATGYPRNGPWFWKEMLAKHPEMFDKANQIRIRSNQAPHINETWLKYNPSHAAFEGKLVHHHINQGKMATGIPEQAHRSFNKQFHKIKGKAKSTGLKGLNALGSGLLIFDMFFNNNPHSLGSMFETRKEGKLYYDHESDNYFEITSKKMNKDESGNVVSADLTMDVYSSYSYDEDQGKYIGAGEKKTVTSTVYYGEDAKKIYLNLINGGKL
jgi:hypothetical protein